MMENYNADKWCRADDCPTSICGGPHRAVLTSLGWELLAPGQKPVGQPREADETTSPCPWPGSESDA